MRSGVSPSTTSSTYSLSLSEMAGSRWVKLDSDYPQNPKIHALSNEAFRLHVTLIAYCAKELTDGHVNQVGYQICTSLVPIPRRSGTKVWTELVTAGLLEKHSDGWTLHDFLDMNPQLERTIVENRRKRWRSHKQVNGHEFQGGIHGDSTLLRGER